MSMPANHAPTGFGDLERDVEQTAEADIATVLLVDDQALIAMVVRKMLAGDPSISFHVCTDATEALGVARQLRPTVILQDLVMPGTDGLELLMAYRSMPETRDIPIIVLSSNDEPGMKKAAFAMGANDYMVKLPEPIELVARIRYHSRSYMALIQRDNAYRALRRSQQQLLETNRELRRLTNLDGLTGLANRRNFDEYLSQEWATAQSSGTELSLLMIDVDCFKSYNDRLGHLAGDDALQRVAGAIGAIGATGSPGPAGAPRGAAGSGQGNQGSPGLAARFGGEEFSLVLPDTSAAAASAAAEALRRRVEALALAHESPVADCLTVSVGVATMRPIAERSPLDLIAAADARLYQAKCDGRNRVVAG